MSLAEHVIRDGYVGHPAAAGLTVSHLGDVVVYPPPISRLLLIVT
jgi:hypothetical protein